MTHEEVVDKLIALVHREYRLEVTDGSADMLETLGLDSLDVTEMVFMVEEEFRVEIATDDLYGCRCLNQLADIVVAQLSGAADQATAAERVAAT